MNLFLLFNFYYRFAVQLYKLNTESSKYRLPFITTLFLICTVIVFSIAISPVMMTKINTHLTGNETLCKNEQNLEFKADDSTSTSSGLKVEVVEIASPASVDSGDKHISNLNLLIKIYLKKKCSLISHSNLIISKTLHLSPLITKLQI